MPARAKSTTATRWIAVAGTVAVLVAVAFASGCAARGAPPASAAHAPAGAARSGTSAATSPARPVAGESPELTFWRNRADLIQPPPPPRPVPLALPRVLRWRAPNGLDVVVVPRPGLPIVSFSVAIKAGGYDEHKNQTQGVSDFTAAMLRKGTRTRTADQVSDAIDFVGGSLDTGTGAENTIVTCSAPSTSARLCLDLLADVLLNPTFPEAEMPEIRDQVLANLAARVDDPHQLAAEHFDNLFFGEEHPDGWVLAPEHVRAITRDRLVQFWKTFYRPNNAMLAVAGDVDVAALKATIARAFAAWKPAPIPARPAFQIPVAHGMRAILVDKPDLSQTTMMFGHVGIRHADPDWYAATLVDYVLGGSDFSSRLMTEVRSKRGLTYGIGSSFGAPLYQGAFRVSAATRNETAWDALLVAIDEMRKMKAAGPTATELSKAQGYYAGSTPFELESAAGLARGIVGAELHGLGIAYVQDLAVRLGAVDVTAARAAAKAHLFPDDLAVVLVGRADVIEPQLRQAKIVYEKIDYRAPISSAARAAAGAPQPSSPSPSPSPRPSPTSP